MSMGHIKNTLIFLREFFKNWRRVGSVTPSSRFLVREMLLPIDFTRDIVIVELGPGMGTMTQEILARMNTRSKLVVFEIHQEFCDQLLKTPDPRLTVECISALEINKFFSRDAVDYVVSGIPLTTLPHKDKQSLLKAIRDVLGSRGMFIQFQYSLEAKDALQQNFKEVENTFVARNVPPAFVYQCHQ